MIYSFNENTENENRAWKLEEASYRDTDNSTKRSCFYDFAADYHMTFSGYDKDLHISHFAERIGNC